MQQVDDRVVQLFVLLLDRDQRVDALVQHLVESLTQVRQLVVARQPGARRVVAFADLAHRRRQLVDGVHDGVVRRGAQEERDDHAEHRDQADQDEKISGGALCIRQALIGFRRERVCVFGLIFQKRI